jgi:hypothetical protein
MINSYVVDDLRLALLRDGRCRSGTDVLWRLDIDSNDDDPLAEEDARDWAHQGGIVVDLDSTPAGWVVRLICLPDDRRPFAGAVDIEFWGPDALDQIDRAPFMEPYEVVDEDEWETLYTTITTLCAPVDALAS